MNLSPLEQINNLQNTTQNQQSPEALRRAAEQFEAVLLMQLTSSLNGTNDGDDDALFGGDGGTDLAKKMFSEQLATTMAQSRRRNRISGSCPIRDPSPPPPMLRRRRPAPALRRPEPLSRIGGWAKPGAAPRPRRPRLA